MNIVLLADKKLRKNFENAVKKNPTITLLGVEMVIRGNTMSRIAEHHNPHVLVIYKGVPEKDGLTEQDVISFLRMKRPNLRIVYVYGKVQDTNAFIDAADALVNQEVYDIVTDMDFQSVFDVLENPMTVENVKDYIEELLKEPEQLETSTDEVQETPEILESLELDFPSVTAHTEFDMERIMTVTQSASGSERICIGIGQLQHHNGCTHTAFEIATIISRSNSAAVVIADDETFHSFAAFYKIKTSAASEGLNVKGIDVYPYSKLAEIRELYSAVICDFGYLREEWKKGFGECDVKIMLCSAAEWDMPLLLNYVNYSTESYLRDIHFLFPRVTQGKFVKYSKQLLKSGIVSYRLHNSPDWSHPHTDNMSVYKAVLKPYSTLPNTPKPKRRLFKVK